MIRRMFARYVRPGMTCSRHATELAHDPGRPEPDHGRAMIRIRLDSRGWNTEHPDFRPQNPPTHPETQYSEDRRLKVALWAVCAGFLVAGILGLLGGTPVEGIG